LGKWLSAAIIAVALMAMPKLATAGHICWIDHIQREADGLNVYFAKKANLWVNVAGADGGSKRYAVGGGLAYALTTEGRSQNGSDHLLVKDGYKIFLSQIEDSCTISAEINDHHVGLHAYTHSLLPGHPPVAIEGFIQEGSATDNVVTPTTDEAARGRQLRAEIDDVYKKLSAANAIKNNGRGRNLITDVVKKYIPVGTSFDQAEAVLRAAGFAVPPHRPNPHVTDGNPLQYIVAATIDHYVPTYFGKTSIEVDLYPRAPNDYSVVQDITAEITRTLL